MMEDKHKNESEYSIRSTAFSQLGCGGTISPRLQLLLWVKETETNSSPILTLDVQVQPTQQAMVE